MDSEHIGRGTSAKLTRKMPYIAVPYNARTDLPSAIVAEVADRMWFVRPVYTRGNSISLLPPSAMAGRSCAASMSATDDCGVCTVWTGVEEDEIDTEGSGTEPWSHRAVSATHLTRTRIHSV